MIVNFTAQYTNIGITSNMFVRHEMSNKNINLVELYYTRMKHNNQDKHKALKKEARNI